MITFAWIYGSLTLLGIMLVCIGLFLRTPHSKKARAEKLNAAYYVVDYSRFLLVLGALLVVIGGVLGIFAVS